MFIQLSLQEMPFSSLEYISIEVNGGGWHYILKRGPRQDILLVSSSAVSPSDTDALRFVKAMKLRGCEAIDDWTVF